MKSIDPPGGKDCEIYWHYRVVMRRVKWNDAARMEWLKDHWPEYYRVLQDAINARKMAKKAERRRKIIAEGISSIVGFISGISDEDMLRRIK